jgi:L-alanine-DL-glutamate epimerase-like enolase superfamily enzyme
MKIKNIRPVLLSAPYAKPVENLEVVLHLKSGYRTTGLVEITLEDGTTGLGEAYLAVFAPKVFTEIVNIITPYVIGLDVMDIPSVMQRVSLVTGYWSFQGAAQHVVSAFDIALHDCKGKLLNLPVYKLCCPDAKNTIQLYGSGGDSSLPVYLDKEFEYLKSLGIQYFKIRARKNQPNKARYALNKGAEYGIEIAVDMTQNLANPGNSVDDVLSFHQKIQEVSNSRIFFLEEVLGIYDGYLYPELREKSPVKIAGGEIVTTSQELNYRIGESWYNIAQPDATVIGGITAVLEVFEKAKVSKTEVFVHCWGGPVCMAANYHAALASGGKVAEWPMPAYPLRNEMMVEPWQIKNGLLTLSEQPGLGVKLTEEIEEKYRFREDAVYSCVADLSKMTGDEVWLD